MWAKLVALELIIEKNASAFLGLRASLGTMMKLSLLMLLKNHLHLSPPLMVLATKKELLTRTVGSGKVKEIGKKIGVKPTPGKGNLHYSFSTSTGPF